MSAPDDLPTDQPTPTEPEAPSTPEAPVQVDPPAPVVAPVVDDAAPALEAPDLELPEPDAPELPPPPTDDDAPFNLEPPAPDEPRQSQALAIATGPDGIALPPPPPAVERSDADERSLDGASQSTSLNRRLAPYDLEAEKSILGGILLTNESALDVLEIVKAPDFWIEGHRHIFETMIDMALKKQPIDIITLGARLRAQGLLDNVGGPAYLASLDAFVPATANLTRYARIVHDYGRRRRFITDLHAVTREGYARNKDTDTYLDESKSRLMAHDDDARGGDLVPTKKIIPAVFAGIEERYEKKIEITGVDTGFDMLNLMTSGFQRGDLIIVAGRPSMGKTSVVMNMAAYVAITKALPVAVFEMEMSSDALGQRLFAAEGRVDGTRIRNGKLLDSDWPKLARAADRLHRAPLFIDDTPNLSLNDVRARLRRLKFKHPDLAMAAIDYLQLMKGGEGGDDGREQEVSAISRGLKAIAREFNMPVIALSQLNRGVERREDKRPGLADLRESGALEQDADLIAFVYRDEVYDAESKDKGIAELIIGKQRNGPTGTIRLSYQKEFTLFANLAEDGFNGGAP